MASQTVDALVEGGKASAAPPLGPALGPLGVNIGQVVADINKKTESFKGMQVPVKVEVDTDSKEFSISVGTPPAASLIKKEAKIEKGAGNPLADKVADLRIEQIIKVAKMKEDALLGKSLKEKVKEIIGTCNSMGIMVEGVVATEAIQQVNQGKFDEPIRQEKTELSAEELQAQEEERKKLEEEIKARREEFLTTGKTIMSEMEGKERAEIKAKMVEAKIPDAIIKELLPVEEEKAEGKPEEGKAAEATEGEKEEKK